VTCFADAAEGKSTSGAAATTTTATHRHLIAIPF